MRKLFSVLLVGATVAAWNMSVFAAPRPAELFAPFTGKSVLSKDIPDGYFEPVELNGAALFSQPADSKRDLILPHLGSLAVVHDRTRTVDLGGQVSRWEGHVAGHDALKVTFVKGISGMVSGVIDTPAGRVLLGQAGDYVLYKQSRSVSSSLPDAGKDIPEALLPQPLDDKDSTRRERPAAVAYPTEFNAAALARVPLKGEVEVTLPGAGKFHVIHDNTLTGDLGATTFVGYLKDFGNDFRMVVTYSPAGAQGQISTPYGMYLIKTVGSRQWLIDVNGSGLRHVIPTGNDGVDQGAETPASAIEGAAAQAAVTTSAAASTAVAANQTASATATNSDWTRIDVLVLYTPGMETSYGGAAQVETRVQNLVALANQAYVDSGVKIVLHLAGVVKIDAPDYSSSMDALHDITNGAAPYNHVAWLRDAYGADLVSLLRPFSMAQGSLCGTAWVGGSNGASMALYRSQGFSVVSDGRDGGYYCPAYTFAHELGHNMGSVHDRATVAQQDGSQGAYSYSFGYGVAGQFGTIMSYIDPEIGKFSNPDKLCKGQMACGVAETDVSNSADNVMSLNNTRPYVAGYTSEAVAGAQMISIAGVITAQGKALSGVKMNASSPANCTATGSNGSFSCIVASDWSGNITPSLSGYTFSPETLSLSNLNSNIADQNFTAVPNQNLSLTAAASPSSGSGGGGAVGVESLLSLVMLGRLKARRCRRPV